MRNIRVRSRSITALTLAVLSLSILPLGCNDVGPINDNYLGELTVDPEVVIVGEGMAEVSVLVYKNDEEDTPVQGAEVVVYSSRNQGGQEIDTIDQGGDTNFDGRSVSFISSDTEGPASIVAEVSGIDLCERMQGTECTRAQAIVTFIADCDETRCGDLCVDTDTNMNHCGGCSQVCELENASEECISGDCILIACDDGYGDCDGDTTTGCEEDIAGIDEVCDGIDNDCDGDTDEELLNDCGACYPPNAELIEVCDGIDNDCDGETDDVCDDFCNDDNLCTADTWVVSDPPETSHCSYEILDIACDDEDPCTINDWCNAFAQCVGENKVDHLEADGGCIDDDLCTSDACVADTGDCTNTAVDCSHLDMLCFEGVCDPTDGECDQICLEGTTCSLGGQDGTCSPPGGGCICQGITCITVDDCPDANPCTIDQCIPSGTPGVNVCNWVNAAEGTGCNDDVPCTTDDRCNDSGNCAGTDMTTLPVAEGGCIDGDVCTDDTCNAATGACENPNNTEPCDDQNWCTWGDTCADGNCVGIDRMFLDEPDGCVDTGADRLCTVDSCDAGNQQCVHAPKDCSGQDGPCVMGVCQIADGACLAEIDPVQIGQACTFGPCDGICDDAGICVAPGCSCSDVADCDDGNQCTIDACVASLCEYTNAPLNTPCDDGVACTNPGPGVDLDRCGDADGICAGTASDAFCDDSSDCTIDWCDPANDCQNDLRVIDPDSAVTVSSTCLTLGANGHATVFVALQDDQIPAGDISDATVTFSVAGEAVTWMEGAVSESTSVPGTYYRTLIAPATGVDSTISVDVVCGGAPVPLNGSVTVTYANPQVGDRGTGGCSPGADGNLRVRVVQDENGAPIEGAHVMVGLAEGTPFQASVEDFLAGNSPADSNLGLTDVDGYAYFYDLGTALDGPLTVTAGQADAAAVERAYFTYQEVNAADLGFPLRLSSPVVTKVRFSEGELSDYDVTTGIYTDAQGAIVVPEMHIDEVTMIDVESIMGTFRCMTLPAGMGSMAIPENMFLPGQPAAPGINLDQVNWNLTFPQNSRLNVLYGTIPQEQITSTCEISGVLANFLVAPYDTPPPPTYGELGFLPSTATGSDATGLPDANIVMEHRYTRTLTVTTTGKPANSDLLAGVMGDYTGADGSGTNYMNSLVLVPYLDAAPNDAVVPFAADATDGNVPSVPDPGNARYFAVVMAMYFDPPTARVLADRPPPTAENGVSSVFWRDDGSGGAPISGAADDSWNIDSFLAIAKLKTDAANKYFVWDDVSANGATPQFTVNEMFQITRQYRDAPLACSTEIDLVSKSKDLYWEVWRPYNPSCWETTGNEVDPSWKECMTMPVLPAGWPRAGTDAATGKDDGYPPRQGAGSVCADDTECSITGDTCVTLGFRCIEQRHRSCEVNLDCLGCMAGDLCGTPGNGYDALKNCLASDGTNNYYQQNTWHLRAASLGTAGSFDFNNFSVDDRIDFLTHESTNRLPFAQ